MNQKNGNQAEAITLQGESWFPDCLLANDPVFGVGFAKTCVLHLMQFHVLIAWKGWSDGAPKAYLSGVPEVIE